MSGYYNDSIFNAHDEYAARKIFEKVLDKGIIYENELDEWAAGFQVDTDIDLFRMITIFLTEKFHKDEEYCAAFYFILSRSISSGPFLTYKNEINAALEKIISGDIERLLRVTQHYIKIHRNGISLSRAGKFTIFEVAPFLNKFNQHKTIDSSTAVQAGGTPAIQ